MDPSLYHTFFEVEDRHWWFVGRRAIVETLIRQALAGAGDSGPSSLAGAGGAAGGPAGATRAPARRILDVGCGTGGMLPLLERFGRVTVIDSEPLALDYCRRRGITDVHLQEGFQSDPDFDLVTLFDVLEHVADEAGLLNQLAGYLRPGGLLVITVPAFQFLWSRHDDLNRHQRRYTRGRLAQALRAAGFEIRRATYFNTIFFPAAALVRLVQGRGGADSGPDQADSGPDQADSGPDQAGTEEVLEHLRIGPLNGPLAMVFGFERHLLRHLDLPFGVSLAAIARWPAKATGARQL